MNKKIKLPELENPINSNFNEESSTAGLPCAALAVGVAVMTFIAD